MGKMGRSAAAVLFAAAVCAALFFLLHTAAPQTSASSESFRLGTYVRLSVYGSPDPKRLLSEADDAVARLESLFSANIPTSDVARLNAAGGRWVQVSDETAALLEKALSLAELTGGAFNPAIGGIVKLWKIGTPEARIPGSGEISAAMPFTDYRKIELRFCVGAAEARIPDGMSLDLGAVAKGFVADILKEKLKAGGAKSALIDLGGNLDVLGPSPKGGAWRLGLQLPWGARGEYFGIVEASDVSVVTSGPYERYFEKDGVRYHHIIDPETGRPADSDLSSVSVIGPDSASADALCTALYVMGSEKAAEFLAEHGDINAVLLKAGENKILVTAGAAEIFRPARDSFSVERIGP